MTQLPHTPPAGGPPPPEPAEVIDDPRAISFDAGPDAAPWRILVGLPRTPPPAAGYSAIVAMDGNATFPLLWHEREAAAPDAPVLLVGIGYPCATRFDLARRWYDLTSPHMVSPPGDIARGPDPRRGDFRTGGNDALLEAIVAEILPALQARYAIDTENLTLYGHSFGGLFAMHTLLRQPRLFARYVPADPSTWWNAGEPLREAAAFAAGCAMGGRGASPHTAVSLCASGSCIGPDVLQPTPHDLFQLLSGVDALDVEYHAFPEAKHGQLIPLSISHCVQLHLRSVCSC